MACTICSSSAFSSATRRSDIGTRARSRLRILSISSRLAFRSAMAFSKSILWLQRSGPVYRLRSGCRFAGTYIHADTITPQRALPLLRSARLLSTPYEGSRARLQHLCVNAGFAWESITNIWVGRRSVRVKTVPRAIGRRWGPLGAYGKKGCQKQKCPHRDLPRHSTSIGFHRAFEVLINRFLEPGEGPHNRKRGTWRIVSSETHTDITHQRK